MTNTEIVWMTPTAHTRLKNKLAALRSQPNIEVPDDFMDYDDNLIARYRARQEQIRELDALLTNAIVSEDPGDIYTAEVEHESDADGNAVTDVGVDTAQSVSPTSPSPNVRTRPGS